jgi:hypothetical protein
VFVPGSDLLYESVKAVKQYEGRLHRSGEHVVGVCDAGDEPVSND